MLTIIVIIVSQQVSFSTNCECTIIQPNNIVQKDLYPFSFKNCIIYCNHTKYKPEVNSTNIEMLQEIFFALVQIAYEHHTLLLV